MVLIEYKEHCTNKISEGQFEKKTKKPNGTNIHSEKIIKNERDGNIVNMEK